MLVREGMKLQLKTPMAVTPENHAVLKTNDPSLRAKQLLNKAPGRSQRKLPDRI